MMNMGGMGGIGGDSMQSQAVMPMGDWDFRIFEAGEG